MRTRVHQLPHHPDIQAQRMGTVGITGGRSVLRRNMGADGDVGAHVEQGIGRACAKCGNFKPRGDFHRSRTGQFSYCGECRRAYDRRYYAERGKAARLARVRVWRDDARAWMAALKEGRPCADCGEVFPPCVMHWDHLPGYPKVAAVSAMVGNRRRHLVLEELAKCELVCANC